MKLLGALLVLTGVGAWGIALLGVHRFPTLLTKLHAAAMGETLAPLLLFAGLACLRPELPFVGKLVLLLSALWVTSPAASHLIAWVETKTNPSWQEGGAP